MAKKITGFKTRGMNRDLSVSAFNPEFSFENHNLRLSTNDGNTLMSWVNERGTEELSFIGNQEAWSDTDTRQTDVTAIEGTAIGSAIINNQLVLFTHMVGSSEDESDTPSDGEDDGEVEPYAPLGKFEPVPNLTKATKSRGNTSKPDRIYLIKYTEDKTKLKGILLFNGNLNFDIHHPIETLVSYESELIQKVYWTDGKNQPRFINVALDKDSYYKDGFPINDSFDFVRELNLQEVINVTRVANTAGEFPAGVIQYAFTYYNKYGQESNIFYTTPLYYISHLNRGGAPDDKVANAFKLSISNIDTNFDYLRIYSIVRTSLNATPIVKRVQDLKIYRTVSPIDPTTGTDAQKYLFSIGEIDKDDVWEIFTYPYTADSIQVSVSDCDPENPPVFNNLNDYTAEAVQLPPAGTLLDSNDYQNPHIVTINEAWDANNVEGDALDESTTSGSGQSIAPAPPVPAPDPSDPSCYYTVDTTNHTAGFYNPTSTSFVGEVTILSTVELDGENYTVVEISDNACYNNGSITSLVVPSSVVEIGDSSFAGCVKLRSVTVQDALNAELSVIGSNAFYNCTNLEEVVLPPSVTTINSQAFRNCRSLVEINIQDTSITELSNDLFSGCNSLSEVIIPNNVTVIQSGAFMDSGLTSISISENITTIDQSTFSGCGNLKNITINSKTIGTWFNGLTSIESIVIGDNTTNIEYAFAGCTGVKTLIVGSNVGTLPVFSSFTRLETLVINGVATSISDDAIAPFKNSVRFLTLNCSTVGTWFNHTNSTASDMGQLENVVLGSGVKIVVAAAFFGCSYLKNLTLGENIETIGEEAFCSGSKLKAVTALMAQPVTINQNTFYSYNTTTLYVKDDYKTAYEEADNWKNFRIVSIEGGGSSTDSVIYIGGLYYRLESYGPVGTHYGETYYDHRATVVTAPEEEGDIYNGDIVIPSTVTFAGITYVVTAIDSAIIGTDGAFAGCNAVTSIVIPDTVEVIGTNAFYQCTGLTTIIIGRGVSFIGVDAFKECKSLERLIVKDLLKWCRITFEVDSTDVPVTPYSNPLNNDKCNLCDENGSVITTLVIPSGCRSIKHYAFYNADSIEEIIVPSSLEFIRKTSFEDCDNITSVTINSEFILKYNPDEYNILHAGTERESGNDALDSTFGDNVKKYTLASNITAIGKYAFSGCIAIEEINIPEDVEIIDNYAFDYCTGLTSIDFTNAKKLRVIGEGAFKGCTGFNKIVIPNSVTIIRPYAFEDCSNITSLLIGTGLGDVSSSSLSDGLGARAFAGCSNLVSVKVNMMSHIPPLRTLKDPIPPPPEVPTIDKEVFDDISDDCVLTVPPGMINTYVLAYWTSGVFKGGIVYPKDPRFAEGETHYYIFEQDDYENLIIKLGESYYTWGKDCQNATLYFYPAKTKFDYINTKNVLTSLTGPLFICEQPTTGGGYEKAYLIKVDKVDKGDSRLEFIDTNTSGEIIDPTSLLYLGGETIIAQTIEQKDNTLFLGNITTNKKSLGEIKSEILEDTGATTDNPLIATDTKVRSVKKSRPYYMVSGDLSYINTLTCPEGVLDANNLPTYYQGASGFKSNEYYRLGVQFQDKTGKWSEPCWIGDKQGSRSGLGITSYGPEADWSGDSAKFNTKGIGVIDVPEFEYTITSSIQELLKNNDYKRMRAVYAVPNNLDRTIICQGVICPTMYRDKDRTDKTVYAQSSWLFRAPFKPNENTGYRDVDIDENGTDTGKHGGSVEYRQDLPSTYGYTPFGLDSNFQDYAEEKAPYESYAGGAVNWGERSQPSDLYADGRPSSSKWEEDASNWFHEDANIYKGVWMPYYRSTEIMGYYNEEERYRIDNFFGTLHSPDIEFESITATTELKGFKVFNVGYSTLTSTCGDIDIQTVTPAIGTSAKGFVNNKIATVGTSALVSGNFYEDNVVACWDVSDAGVPNYVSMDHEDSQDNDLRIEDAPYLWPVYMWHRKGSLNNDVSRANRSAELRKKIISNYRNAGSTIYNQNSVERAYNDMQFYNFTESSQVCKINNHIYQGCVDTMVVPSEPSDHYLVGSNNIKFIKWGRRVQGLKWRGPDVVAETWVPTFTDVPLIKLHQDSELVPNSKMSAYFATDNGESLDTVISAGEIGFSDSKKAYWYGIVERMDSEFGKLSSKVSGLTYFKDGIPIKYKSTPHIAIEFDSSVPGAKQIYEWTAGSGEFDPAASAGKVSIVEIRRDYDKNVIFGGTTTDAFQAATWIPCGPVVDVNPNQDTIIEFKWGDTYFQRYECLKTYSYTPEDINQVIEIGSFMLETRTNIDGRYDRNRGMTSNLTVSPQNFNLINPVYSQMDNFFSYKILPEDDYKNKNFANQVTWTKIKESGAEIDLWTNITLASVLELDGTCGQLNKLIRFSDQLIAFQDTGISQILYNENAQISTTEGVPVELGNSGKVTGKKYYTNTVGCSNKWSISRTPAGLYFLDSNDKSIYIFGGDLSNLSGKMGFNTWCKNNIPSATVKWCPPYEENGEEKGFDNFVTYYDRINQDVLIINKETALAFSEKVGAFTSFYDYGNTPYFCNLEDTGIWLKSNNNATVIWKHQAGDYCRFFDVNKSYSITLVGNPEPQTDKIFTNMEFRACIDGESLSALPFDSLETWDEYQHGIANLSIKSGLGKTQHHLQDVNSTASLNRKFRMWRCDIPRDNYPLTGGVDIDTEKGIARYTRKPLDRMRNSWIYIKLKKDAAVDNTSTNPVTKVTLPKTEVHDFIMTYYN